MRHTLQQIHRRRGIACLTVCTCHLATASHVRLSLLAQQQCLLAPGQRWLCSRRGIVIRCSLCQARLLSKLAGIHYDRRIVTAFIALGVLRMPAKC